MVRKKKTYAERPLINLTLIMFFGLAMYDTGGMIARSLSGEIAAAAYFAGALIAFISLLMNRRAVWLWLLVTVLLGCGLPYLISLKAIVWIIGIAALLFFWIKANNRKWHRLKF